MRVSVSPLNFDKVSGVMATKFRVVGIFPHLGIDPLTVLFSFKAFAELVFLCVCFFVHFDRMETATLTVSGLMEFEIE